MKTDISDLRSQIIKEAREIANTDPGEDEITTAMLGKELGCNSKKAYIILQTLVSEGKATVRKNGPRGRNVYKTK